MMCLDCLSCRFNSVIRTVFYGQKCWFYDNETQFLPGFIDCNEIYPRTNILRVYCFHNILSNIVTCASLGSPPNAACTCKFISFYYCSILYFTIRRTGMNIYYYVR